MKLGILVYSNDSETVWNAFRLANFALKEGDEVKVFLLGKGVESESLDPSQFRITDQMKEFVSNRGMIYACGTCLKIRQAEATELCPVSTMSDLYAIIRECEKVISF
jgi:sulfur relay (sulfurtransferase) complex TusBCD TusD component (DsrE family)